MPGISLYAWQGNTPQAALEEIASTNEPEVIARHLPEPVQKSIEALPKVKKKAILEKLLELKSSQLHDCTVRPAQVGDGWEIVDEDGDVQGKVRLDNAFISGLDAMLPLRIETDGNLQSFIVTMHLEGDEWRIDGFGPWEKADLGLAKLIHEPTEMEQNEAAARATLQEVVGALQRYAGRLPDVGYPSGLAAIVNPNVYAQRYLGFLDESFAADPLVKKGYRFRYLQTAVGDGTQQNLGRFELTAVPVEFGKTGVKSFFVDETGRVHETSENRPATVDDPPGEGEEVRIYE